MQFPELDKIFHAFEETIAKHSKPFENIIASIEQAFNATVDTPQEKMMIYQECLECILSISQEVIEQSRTALQKYSGYARAVESMTVESLQERFGIEIDIDKLKMRISEQIMDTEGSDIPLVGTPPTDIPSAEIP